MTEILLWLLMLSGAAILVWGLQSRDRMIQFPFLAVVVFIGWVTPQLLGLTSYPSRPQGALEKTIFMAWLCLLACWAGYVFNRRPARLFEWRFARRRLVWASAVLSLLGAFFFYQVSLLAVDVVATFGGQWTGVITIYAFLARLLAAGFAMALLLHLAKPTWPTLIIVLFGLSFYLDRIVIHGRRAETVELCLMVLMALWFQRRWLPPRSLMIGALLLGALFVNSIGEYRSRMLGKDQYSWSGAGVTEILEIDFAGNLRDIAEGKQPSYELYNAMLSIEATDRRRDFDYGLSLWNGFVQRYVPGQLLRPGVKRSLYIEGGDSARQVFGFVPKFGTTMTGLTDAFQSFWFFGAIKFFLIGFIMSRWWRAARAGNRVAQIVLMLCVSASLHAITHTTHHFFVVFVEIVTFMLPALLYARVPMHRRAMCAPAQAENALDARRQCETDQRVVTGPVRREPDRTRGDGETLTQTTDGLGRSAAAADDAQ
jgi:hypothetical protein